MKTLYWKGSHLSRSNSRTLVKLCGRKSAKQFSTVNKCRQAATAQAFLHEVEHDAPFPQPPTRSLPSISPLRNNFKFSGLSAAEILHETLVEQKVEQVFGCLDARHDPTFDRIWGSKQIQTVMARHEQSTGHMAEGYARATGKLGVAFVTSGSGLTNLVTPMQDALCDGTPMVVVCGQPPHAPELEDMDVLSISESCTKWNVMVNEIENLPRRINQAFEVATSGRHGPVLVYLPRHLNLGTLARPANQSPFFARSIDRSTSTFYQSDISSNVDKVLHRVAHLINIAKKPVLYVGQGMLARPEGPAILKQFADKTSIPVTTSLQGLGAFDEHDPKALHMLGLHGTAYANLAIQNADLILALGARFDDRVTGSIPKFAPAALVAAAAGRGGIVHFDIAPKNVNKVVLVNETVQGDCTTKLAELIPLIKQVSNRPEWLGEIREWKRKFPLSAYNRVPTLPNPGLIRAQAVIEKLSDMTEHMKDRTIISTGVGQHQMWAAQYYRWRYPRTMITSGGLGTMGYGLPAAIGAKIARPESLVIDIDGDASFNMTIAELATAAQHNIGVKVLLFNNEQMGMVSDLQRHYYNKKFAHNRQANPDFVRAVEAFGVAAQRCSDPKDVESKLKWLLESDGPAVLEIQTEQHGSVLPVVFAGKGLHEFTTYPEIP